MSEQYTEADPGPEIASAPADDLNIFHVPVIKGGKDAFVDVNIADLPEEAFKLVIAEGLKVIANARMSKVAGPKAIESLRPEEAAKHHADAMEKANENIAALRANKTKTRGKSAAKSDVPREVMTEAMKIGRAMVKDLIREAKGYPSTYAASEITAGAKALIERKPEILTQAAENIAKRKATETQSAADIIAILKPDAKLVEKAAKAKVEKAAQLSAKQAGTTAKRAGAPPPPRRSRGDAPSAIH
jgi:hypothetical protein